MSNVVLDMSISLDGFVAGPDVSEQHPMGRGGESLHAWLFRTPKSAADAEVEREMRSRTGAVILGHRTFQVGVELWEDVPFPVPAFVLTHTPRDELIMTSGTFTFVTDGIHSALQQARGVAGGQMRTPDGR